MSERKVIIASRVGLHARPASIFAEAVAKTSIEVTIALDGQPVDDAVDASSILSLMSLGAGNGDVVILRAEGAGADEALESLATILETDLDAE